MTVTSHIASPPRVRLVGQFDHADFAGADALLRAGAEIVTSPEVPPELIVVAQSRPGMIAEETIQSLLRAAPLSGVVALLGTWCEGEPRTGRPWPGVERRYWYEFPAWWRRQLALRAAGRCPDWAQPYEVAPASRGVLASGRGGGLPGSHSIGNRAHGLVVLSAAVRETAEALSDALQQAGYAALWQPPGRPAPFVRGALAGIWDGGQLNDREEENFAAFCRGLSRDAVPVIALLDFPRRDRCERARELGAAAVLGKPWLNADLVTTIENLTVHRANNDELTTSRAA